MHYRILMAFAIVITNAAAVAADSPALRISKDGSAVEDIQAKLVWARCAEGMTWNGATCSGMAEFVTYAEAMALAAARSKAEGVRWRVPGVAEMKQLSKRVAGARMSSHKAFPAAPQGWYWTASARVDTGAVNQYDYRNIQRGINEKNVNRVAYLHAWSVDIDTGEARGDASRRSKLPVRLVRQLAE